MRRVRSGSHRNLKTSARLFSAAAGLIFAFAFAAGLPAQATHQDDQAPPPLRRISKDEKSRLESSKEPKQRIAAALALMDGRIKRAEELKNAENFDLMFLELGGFHGLMDNTLDFLNADLRQRGKALNHFKRYEMGLRTFTPRLELIRRDLPLRYDPYVVRLLKYLRDARTKSIEPFFGDTVIPDGPA
jgi:hypothetical protein